MNIPNTVKSLWVIGDPHAKVGVSNRRFDWLGRMMADERPDVVLCIGDFHDMPSLSSYDEGKKSAEGKRIRLDLAHGHDALARIVAPVIAMNTKRSKERRYQPRLFMLGGNHDHGRIDRATNDDAKIDGLVSKADLGFEKYGWEVTNFQDVITVGGISFSHYFVSGVMCRPIGGETPALTLLKKKMSSCMQGHSHLFDIAFRHDALGRRRVAAHVGCYLDPDQIEDYAGPANAFWSRGILKLTNVSSGDFESFNWVDVRDIRRQYE